MKKQLSQPIYSGAEPQQVIKDLQPLTNFTNKGISLRQLEKMISDKLIPHLMKYNLPGFQSMFNAFPEEGAEFGSRIALTYNQGVTNWQVSPGGAVLEELCCKALCRLFNLSSNSDATFMYSGTYANQQALYMALHKTAEKKGFDLGKKGLSGFHDPTRLAVLTSIDAHFSIKHAVRIMGLGDSSIINLEVDQDRKIDIKKLKKRLPELQKSRDIFCITATSGTTSTGVIDPIQPLSDISKNIGSWLHIDGAYGFAYSLLPERQKLFKGYQEADSICWDPHKQLGIPIPNSLLFVKNQSDFLRMALHSTYFNRKEDCGPNPGIKSPPSTRPFSALPLICSILYQGLENLRARLLKPLMAIQELNGFLRDESCFELFHPPHTGILCFRYDPFNLSEEEKCTLQEFIYQKIMKKGERSISITSLNNKKALRILAISEAVKFEELKKTIDDIKMAGNDFKRSIK